ncbi:hypothetical protein DFJ43DRAFT_611941 [Lentinula guzmanii]|uniref:Uncharacterized protein n=1 Tax=Lentinula guzmanii TaxID=2804957 RepID=A0AA38JU30_9AGAR|nr:hypothetical protein DFJ43DRAFT_611941 [Lentinula guzmanii]
MLIRLIPSPSQPTVLFKLVFQNLPETLQAPASWVNYLAALDSDDLEIPELMHALDKAVGVQSILEEVTFDLIGQKIKCVFLDGETEEWDIASSFQGLSGEAAHRRNVDLVRRLDSVIDDVNESAAEMVRDRKREEQQKEQRRIKEEEERMEAAKQDETTNPSSSFGRKNRPGHKKQRSLLMNLVSSFLPLSLNSPRSPRSPIAWQSSSPSTTRTPSPSPSIRSSRFERGSSQTHSAPSTLSRSATSSPGQDIRSHRPTSTSSSSSPLAAIEYPFPVVIVAPPLPPPLSPRALRRRARSSLVDAFRLYVLPELNRRIRFSHFAGSPICSPVATYGSDTSAPYYTWIVGSTLKRVDSRLSEIGKDLKAELDGLGIELNALPLGALAGLGIGSIASAEPQIAPAHSLPRSLTSLFGGSSDGDSGSRSETEGETSDFTKRHDGDNLSEVTLIDTNASSSTENPLTVHYHLSKSSNGNPTPSVNAFPPSMYLRTSSSTDIFTPAPIAHLEVPLPESLNELLIQHNDFSSLHLRLAHLLFASHTRAAAAAADITQREAILEVRGRRRSWLNGTLKVHESSDGGTKTNSVTWCGALASPFRQSGLGRYTYSSDEWECDPYNYLKVHRMAPLFTPVTEAYPNPFGYNDNGFASHFYGNRRKRTTTGSNVSLFPVCEEETICDDSPGGSSVHKGGLGYRRYLDVEIDEDDEDDEDGDETDVDPLVDIEFDGLDDDDVLPRPSQPFTQLHPRDSASILKQTPITSGQAGIGVHFDAKLPKGASDPFEDPVNDFATPLVLVAATNISKRIKNEIKVEALSDNISDVVTSE